MSQPYEGMRQWHRKDSIEKGPKVAHPQAPWSALGETLMFLRVQWGSGDCGGGMALGSLGWQKNIAGEGVGMDRGLVST